MIKPLGKQVLIKPLIKEQVLIGDEIKCDYGEILEIGDDCKNLKIGDIIGYEKWGLKELEYKEEMLYFILEDSDFLLCKITNE